MLNFIVVFGFIFGLSFLIGKTTEQKDSVNFAMNWTLGIFLFVVALVGIVIIATY